MLLQKSFRQIRWKSLVQPWQNIDWWLFVLPIALTALGGIMIRSVEMNQGWTDWRQHWVTGIVGVVLALIVSRWRYDQLIRWRWIIYGITNLSLIAVMFIGREELGAQRWIPILGFNLQPSEFAKLGVIITIAALLSDRPASSIPMFLKTLGVTAVPWVFVFLEPNLGTSLVFGAITIGMLYWGNANPGWVLLMFSPFLSAILFNVFLPIWFVWVVLIGVVAWRSLPWYRLGTFAAVVINLISGALGHFLWSVLKDYQKQRLTMFLNPDQDPLGGGYHLIQSRIAVGAGGLWGKGLNQGSQTQLNFIPEQHTDFIFAAIGEELGFVGCFLVLLAFWIICLRLVIIAQNARDNFGSLIAIGVLSMVVFQTVVNVGMTIGLSPVTGIPLPWLSYGRSALLMNFLAIGVVQSVANFRQRLSFKD
jgi:rod shape determining protein RodA